jgi:flavin reductase (DIM6/NTAB) family NADH-FMN oxidoreductase RutF
MEFALSSLAESEAYYAFAQVLIPRPVAWVLSDNGTAATSGDSANRWNLAPFSYFNAITSAPPMVMFSIGNGMAGRDKDTHRNLRARAACTICLASADQATAVQATADELPPGIGEATHAGLELSDWSGPLPRVTTAPVAMACTATQFTRVGNTEQIVVFATVEKLWLRDDVGSLDERGRLRIDVAAFNPLARLGRGGYASLGTVFRP